MGQHNYTEFITNNVSNIPYGQPFPTDTIAKAMAEAYGVPIQKVKPIANVMLKRMKDKGLVERFQKGIYYRAKQTVFGKARPSEELLEAQTLIRYGDEIIGYETGFSLMNKMGLTTLVPKKSEVATNAYRKKINDKFISVTKPVIRVNADNFAYLQLLDVIKHLPEAPVDAEKPEVLLRNFVKKNNLDPIRMLTYARQHYPKKTLLKVVDLLVER
jgi:hypothetical protein